MHGHACCCCMLACSMHGHACCCCMLACSLHAKDACHVDHAPMPKQSTNACLQERPHACMHAARRACGSANPPTSPPPQSSTAQPATAPSARSKTRSARPRRTRSPLALSHWAPAGCADSSGGRWWEMGRRSGEIRAPLRLPPAGGAGAGAAAAAAAAAARAGLGLRPQSVGGCCRRSVAVA